MSFEGENMRRQFKLKSKIDLSTMLGLKPFGMTKKSSTDEHAEDIPYQNNAS